MRVGAVVLGRLNSKRLPGKILNEEVEGRPLIAYVVDRLQSVRGLDLVVVATSSEPQDDPLETWCKENDVAVHRGALDDVLARAISAARFFELGALARVNADSPWLDPDLLSEAVERMREGSFDLVTNLVERTWPYGISAEVARLAVLERIHAAATPEQREHVTAALYERPEDFSILNLRSELRGRESELKLTIDTVDDLRRFKQMVGALGARARDATTPEVIAAAREADRVLSEPRR